jgi:hypothetical protein
MKEKHAVDKLLRGDRNQWVECHHQQPKGRVRSRKTQKELRVARVGEDRERAAAKGEQGQMEKTSRQAGSLRRSLRQV